MTPGRMSHPEKVKEAHKNAMADHPDAGGQKCFAREDKISAF